MFNSPYRQAFRDLHLAAEALYGHSIIQTDSGYTIAGFDRLAVDFAALRTAAEKAQAFLAAEFASANSGDTGPYAYIAQVGPDVLHLSGSLESCRVRERGFNVAVAADPAAPRAKVYALSKCAPDVQELIDARNAAVDRNGELLALIAEMRPLMIPNRAIDERVDAALSGFKAPEPSAPHVPAQSGRVVDKAAVRLIERSLRMLRELGRGERLRKALGDYLEGVRRETEN